MQNGVLQRLVEGDDSPEHLYFLNTDADRRAIEQIHRGELDLGAMPKVEKAPQAPERRNIYTLYEENIGLLSPLIAEELKEAEEQYPFPWIIEAFREAVRLNVRKWRYIQRTLENWKAEGRSNAEPWRASQEVPGRGEPSPARGGYIVRRRSS